MGLPLIDGNCINCAVSISSENQQFSKITVLDEKNSLKSLEQEIAVLDAILYIYGFSATNLASAYLDESREEDLSSCITVSETSDYIIKNGLNLCGNCVSVFKQVYVASYNLKKLSKDEALLRKAIKSVSSLFIKIEGDLDKFRCTAAHSESEDVLMSINTVSNSPNFSDTQFSTEPEDLIQTFNFDKDDEEYYDNDVKPDASDEKQSLPSPSTTLPKNSADIISSLTRKRLIETILNKNRQSGSDIFSVRRRDPRKADSKCSLIGNNGDSSLPKNDDSNSNFKTANLKQENLPRVTVDLVRIEEEKCRKRIPLIRNMKNKKMKIGWSKRKSTGLMREQKLKRQKEETGEESSDSEFCAEDDVGNEANDQSGNIDRDKKSRLKSSCKKPKILKCICGKTYSTVDSLRHHEKRHKIQEPVICDTCGASFKKYFLLYIHKNKVHSELPGILFECSECGKKWNTINRLKEHEKRHGKHIKNGTVSPSRQDLEKIINCIEKAPGLRGEQHLKVQKEEFGEINPDIEFCAEEDGVNEATDQSGNIGKDQTAGVRSSCIKILKCSCGKAYSSVDSFRHHEKLHKIQEPVTCDTCGASFNKYSLLYTHKNKEHSELPGILFECNKCGRKCLTRSELKDHEKRHGKHVKNGRVSPSREDLAKMLYCSCGKPYRFLPTLRLHEKTHEFLEPVTCDLCGQTFAFSYQLYGHKSLKHSEMPHLLQKCDFCDVKFFTATSRKKHVLQHHSNSRPFLCEVCGKDFNCPQNLRKHSTSVHSNEGLDKERLKCPECELTLKHSESLRKHMKNKHRTEKTIACHLCGKTTKTLWSMKNHMKIHDPNRNLKTNAPKLTLENSDLDLH